MTERDAFIIGVTAFCKDAGFDYDDANEFARLLLMQPFKAMPIVKRASLNKDAWTFWGSESEPSILGAIGGGLADAGGAIRDVGHAGMGALGYAPSVEYNKLQGEIAANKAKMSEGQDDASVQATMSDEAKQLRTQMREARTRGDEAGRSKLLARYNKLVGAGTGDRLTEGTSMPEHLRKAREAAGLPVGEAYDKLQSARRTRNMMRRERRQLERDYGIGNALKADPNQLPPELRSTLMAIQKHYGQGGTTAAAGGQNVPAGAAAAGGPGANPPVGQPSTVTPPGGANVQAPGAADTRSRHGWAAPKEEGDVSPTAVAGGRVAGSASAAGPRLAGNIPQLSEEYLATIPGTPQHAAANGGRAAGGRRRAGAPSTGQPAGQTSSSPMVDKPNATHAAQLAANEKAYDASYQQSQNRMESAGGRGTPYPAATAAEQVSPGSESAEPAAPKRNVAWGKASMVNDPRLAALNRSMRGQSGSVEIGLPGGGKYTSNAETARAAMENRG